MDLIPIQIKPVGVYHTRYAETGVLEALNLVINDQCITSIGRSYEQPPALALALALAPLALLILLV